jgi:aryl-alcohol dehydrogenase-like predicted oxidoreductase
VLAYCEKNNIGFIPWFPLNTGKLAEDSAEDHGIVTTIATRHGATVGQIALAWLLKKSPVILPIPGTASLSHLEENMAAVDIELSDEEFAVLENSCKPLM